MKLLRPLLLLLANFVALQCLGQNLPSGIVMKHAYIINLINHQYASSSESLVWLDNKRARYLCKIWCIFNIGKITIQLRNGYFMR